MTAGERDDKVGAHEAGAAGDQKASGPISWHGPCERQRVVALSLLDAVGHCRPDLAARILAQ
jgi:hypothetical protein